MRFSQHALSLDRLRRGLLAAFVLGLATSITLAQTALALLALLWLVGLRDPAARREAPWPLLAPVLAFWGATLLSALVSGHPVAGLWHSKDLLLVAALYVTAEGLKRADEAERFLTALALAGALAAAIGLLQVGLCPGSPPTEGLRGWLFHRCDRARGFFSIYMTLAGVLNLLLLATLPRLLSAGALRWWFPPLWLGMVLGLAATYVRGAWLGFAAGVLALLPTSRRGRVLLVLGLAVLVGVALAGPEPLRDRIRSMGDPEEATIKERTYMWRSGIAMWREFPWLGVGPGGVKRIYGDFALPEAIKQRSSHVHNTPLQILVERGVVGLAAWLWIWGAFYWRVGGLLRRLSPSLTRERALAAGSLAAVTGFLVQGLSEYNFGDSETVMVAWTIMALPFAVARAVDGRAIAGVTDR